MAAPRKKAALNSSMILRELQDEDEDLDREYDSGSDFDIDGLSEIENLEDDNDHSDDGKYFQSAFSKFSPYLAEFRFVI